MLKSHIKALGFIVGLTLSGIACAVSMGGMNVTSGLGEPLKLEIELESSSAAEINNLTVRLASPDTFKNAGLDYPYGLPQLKFQIEKHAISGKPFLRVTSVQPINEPFVTLLVELNWSSGKLLREYTFLLDPPGYAAELPRMAEVQPVEPGYASGSELQPPQVATVASTAPAESSAIVEDENRAVPPEENMGAEKTVAAFSTEENAPEEIAPEEKSAAVMDSEASEAKVPEEAAAEVGAGEKVAEEATAEMNTEEMVQEEGVPAEKPAEEQVSGQKDGAEDELQPDEAVPEAAIESDQKISTTVTRVKVKRGDTLMQIARETKSPDVSLERMLVALYHANRTAFDGKNMNRLKAGKILRVPDQAEVDKIGQTQAVKEIRTQVADWQAYRQKLAAARMAVTEQSSRQEASGKISTSVADKAPTVKPSAKEVVRLSKGEAPGDTAATGGSGKSLLDKIHAQEEEAIAKEKALKESGERAALLDKNVKAMQHLMELKSQAASKADSAKLGALPQAPVVSAIPSSTVIAASAVQAVSAVQPAKPQVTPAVEPPEPSLVDDILGEPLYLAGGAAVLLALAGLAFVVKRRRQGKGNVAEEATDDVGDNSSHILQPEAPSPETGDFTGQFAAVSAAGNAPSDDVDPISEADLFLNFGRDEQAEEILKDALNKNPSNHKIHLKLLSIYLNRRDVSAFSAIARQLKDSGDKAAWDQAAAMGLKLEPNNPEYGGVASTEAPKAAPEVMFDVGTAKEKPSSTDFDIGLATTQVASVAAEPSMDSTVVMNAPMDFDVTGSRPVPAQGAVAEPPAMNLDDLIFDVTASHDAVPVQKKEVAPEPAPPKADEGLTFTLDFPSASQPAAAQDNPAKPALNIGLGEINLNLEQSAAPPAKAAPSADGKDEHWHDVATKLDLAKAYQEMGDTAGAREILDEVMHDGDDEQRATAEAMLKQMG